MTLLLFNMGGRYKVDILEYSDGSYSINTFIVNAYEADAMYILLLTVTNHYFIIYGIDGDDNIIEVPDMKNTSLSNNEANNINSNELHQRYIINLSDIVKNGWIKFFDIDTKTLALINDYISN
jgi:hypothetical protein